MYRVVIGIVLVIIVLGGGFYAIKSTAKRELMKNDEVITPSAKTIPSAAVSPASGSAVSDERTKEFTIEGTNMKFTPNVISVKKGDTVKITFKNTGGFHDFNIDEYKVKTNRISSDQQEVVTFTADKAGTFKYYCSVGSHRQLGMEGTLTVE